MEMQMDWKQRVLKKVLEHSSEVWFKKRPGLFKEIWNYSQVKQMEADFDARKTQPLKNFIHCLMEE